MPIFKVKPKQVDIEAIQWTADNKEEVLDWLTSQGLGYSYHDIQSAGQLIFYSDNGPHQVPPGHVIVRCGDGTYGVYSSDTFQNLYEVIE